MGGKRCAARCRHGKCREAASGTGGFERMRRTREEVWWKRKMERESGSSGS